MIRSTLIALAATACLGLAISTVAKAKTNFNIDVGLNVGSGGIYVAPGVGVYDDDVYLVEDECGWHSVKHKKWNKFHTKKIVYFTKEWVCG
jgi:hypothetical protein